jgi:hypothetical protein
MLERIPIERKMPLNYGEFKTPIGVIDTIKSGKISL